MIKIAKKLAALGSVKALKNAAPAIRRAGQAVCREIKDPLIIRKKLTMTDTVYRKKDPKKSLCTCDVDLDVEFRLICAAGCVALCLIIIALIRRLVKMKKNRAERRRLRAARREMKLKRRVIGRRVAG